jgi:subtilisin-like proprotein convertase family protein
MNSRFLTFAVALGLGFNALASLAPNFNAGHVTIPDNDSNGCSDSRTVVGMPGVIADVNVTLDISGGYNGDIYAWLSHGSGLAVLLNRVGISSSNAVGYANQGFGSDAQQAQFTLDDQAAQDVHFYQSVEDSLNPVRMLTGRCQPDGRVIDPGSLAALFELAPRPNLLSAFNNLDPNGEWTLYIADLSPGGESTLNGWGLEITLVPEPASTTLLALGLAAGAVRKIGRRTGRPDAGT